MIENSVEMNEVIGRRRPSVVFLIKILVVMSFPLQGFFGSSEIIWFSVLLEIGGNHVIAFTSIFTLLTGLFIMLPCLIFELDLRKRPISESIRIRAVAASILCWLISMFILFLGIFSFDPFLFQVIGYTPILAISFFVILPLITRESVMLSISAEHHDLSYDIVSSTHSKMFRREKILSGFLWVGLVFSPFMGYMVSSWWNFRFYFMSLFYQFTVYSDYPMIPEGLFPNVGIEIIAVIGPILPFIALLSAIRFVFVRDIFRFQSGFIKKSRLVSIALLGEILPSAIILLITLVLSPMGSITLAYFPVPLLPIIGFAFIRFSKVIHVNEEIFPDHEYRMWYEKERVPYGQELPAESIKVPITYLLVSQIRKRLRG